MLPTLFALFALVQLQHFATCDVGKVTTFDGEVRTKPTAKFVDTLKKILRRDNDDYAEGGRRVATTPAPASLVPRQDEDPVLEQVDDMYRRMMQNRHSRRRHSHGRTDAASSEAGPAEPGAEARTQRNMLGGGVPSVSAGAKLKSAAALAVDQRRAGARVAGDTDMAPARGPDIDELRDKNRLCHRHVLIAEGPQYDSGGAALLPADPLRAARVFGRTPEPDLLLPRCCNCCKKSALGCE